MGGAGECPPCCLSATAAHLQDSVSSALEGANGTGLTKSREDQKTKAKSWLFPYMICFLEVYESQLYLG